MTVTDPAVREAATWVLIFAVIYGCYRLSERRRRREEERARRWRERQQERYWRYEFDVDPPRVFDQERDAA